MNQYASMIMNNNSLLRYFINYYYNEISDYTFERDMEEAKSQGIDEKQYLAEYFASRLLYDEDADILREKTQNFAARNSSS